MRAFLKVVGWLLGVLLVVGIGGSFHPEVQNVFRALSPSTDYDDVPPEMPAALGERAVLVFTKTNGFRHTEAIDAGLAFFKGLANQRGWDLFHTENGAVFNAEDLSRFRVVVWHNASGAPVDERQRAALRAWIEQGGGFVGTHAALDNSHASWSWYQREFVGATFIGHIMGPQFQEATLQVEQPDHPTMQRFGPTLQHIEEWYSFDRSVRGQQGVEVLATVDESTYTPRLKFLWTDEDIAMGDHPAIWTRTLGEGRGFFSILGHQGAAYESPEHQGLLEAAVEWAGQFAEPQP